MRWVYAFFSFLGANALANAASAWLAMAAFGLRFDDEPLVVLTIVAAGFAAGGWAGLGVLRLGRAPAAPRPPAASRDGWLRVLGEAALRIGFVVLLVPPVGGVAMVTTVSRYDLSLADVALGFLVPLYGWAKILLAG